MKGIFFLDPHHESMYRQCLRVPGHRPATSWVHYTTSCNTQSSAPEDGQRISRNMLGWLESQRIVEDGQRIARNTLSWLESQLIVTVASSWSRTLFISMRHGETNINFTVMSRADSKCKACNLQFNALPSRISITDRITGCRSSLSVCRRVMSTR